MVTGFQLTGTSKIMKILINRKPVDGPWGGGNLFVKALVDRLSSNHSIVYELEKDISCFFMVDPRPDNGCPGLGDFLNTFGKNSDIPVIQRVNECDSRKNTEHMDPLLLGCSKYVKKTVFVSTWMEKYFLNKGWMSPSTRVIHNGVDKNIFRPTTSPKRKVNSVVAHHWSNNLLKGFDAYEFLDYLAGKGLIDFTYIGRHRNSFQNANIIPPTSGKDLADNLACHDIYISGSRFDPGPNHVLEAIACGLPTYVHCDGGGAVEFAGKSHTFSNLIELEAILLKEDYEKNLYKPQSWDACIKQYLEIINCL